jgi:SAM-dependent methyltransferase
MATLGGRYIIDRVKKVAISWNLRMPVPPYEKPNFWEKTYRKMGPDEVFEWGEIRASDLHKYTYRLVSYDPLWVLPSSSDSHKSNDPPVVGDPIETTLSESLGVPEQGDTEQPVLILGCGNSRFGEDMVEQYGWKNRPIVQLDIADRVIQHMTKRCAQHIASGDMLVVQDDANVLSAITDQIVASIFDKGLLDAIFCTDDYQQCFDIMTAAHRVLKPGGTMNVLSFSRPQFILKHLILPPDKFIQYQKALKLIQERWEIQIRLLESIYWYRFTKKIPTKIHMKPKHSPSYYRR